MSVELAIYMPLLLLIIFLVVQFALIYLGNLAAGAVARETARVARVTSDAGAAHSAGAKYAANIGQGILEDVTITVSPVGGDRVRVTVSGVAQQISPIDIARVSQTVEGPIEEIPE